MTWLQAAAALAAVAIAAGPRVSEAVTVMRGWLRMLPVPPAEPKEPTGPDYQTAMRDLANVRLRLVRTATLSKDAAEAVETLTLALVAGSDK